MTKYLELRLVDELSKWCFLRVFFLVSFVFIVYVCVQRLMEANGQSTVVDWRRPFVGLLLRASKCDVIDGTAGATVSRS